MTPPTNHPRKQYARMSQRGLEQHIASCKRELWSRERAEFERKARQAIERQNRGNA